MGPGENAGAVDVGRRPGDRVQGRVAQPPERGRALPGRGHRRRRDPARRVRGGRPADRGPRLAALRRARPRARSRYLLDGAVSGIGHYGNSIGVPTVGGEVYFEGPYEQNCLVNAMCLGIARERPPDPQRRGRGGQPAGAAWARAPAATASAARRCWPRAELDSEDDASKRPVGADRRPVRGEEAAGVLPGAAGARHAALAAGPGRRRACRSSSSEMASKGEVGLDLDVSRVPLREDDMEPFEIMVSESQERMLCVVEPGRLAELEEVCERWEVRATVDRRGHRHRAACACSTATSWWATCRSRRWWTTARCTTSSPSEPAEQIYPAPAADARLRRPARGAARAAGARPTSPRAGRCSSSTTASWARARCAAPSRPTPRCSSWSPTAGPARIAVSIDGNGRRVACDPYTGTVEAVLECAANLACVGAEPLGLTNCLNFGNPEKPHVAWQLERSVAGMATPCRALGVPVVGGNVSLYNESGDGPIYPTPVVGHGRRGARRRARRAGPASREEGHARRLLRPVPSRTCRGAELAKLRGERAARRAAGGGPGQGRAARRRPCATRCARAGWPAPTTWPSGGFLVAVAECCLAGGIGADARPRGRRRPACCSAVRRGPGRLRGVGPARGPRRRWRSAPRWTSSAPSAARRCPWRWPDRMTVPLAELGERRRAGTRLRMSAAEWRSRGWRWYL